MDNNIIQSFWHSKNPEENSFSTLELLCIASFLHHGHIFHLYTYTPNDATMQYLRNQLASCKNFENLHIINANSILPQSEIFFDCKKRHISIASFSDYFRYNMLYQKGGWWVDMDVICIRYFDFNSPFVFAAERHGEKTFTANCVIKGEKSSSFLFKIVKKSKNIIDNNDYIPNKTLLDKLLKSLKLRKKRKEKTVNWGIVGPKFLDREIKENAMQEFVCPPEYFCEIDWYNSRYFIDPNYTLPSNKNIYALHAWNATWGGTKQEKNSAYSKECLIEKLKQQYLTPPPTSQG